MSDPTPYSVPSSKNRKKGQRSKKKRRDPARLSYARRFTDRREGLEDAIYNIGISNQVDMFVQTTKKCNFF